MRDPLAAFFHPRGVLVAGASASPTKLSHGVLRNLVTHGYRGAVYPVNPSGGEMLGLQVYRSVAEVPDPVDLAVVVLSAEQTLEALQACGERGIRAAILIASGFAELGASGREREERLRETARRYGIRFIGPNCIGVIDTHAPIDTTFAPAMPEEGSIGFVSHSGAVCGGTLDWASAVGIGFSRVISLGNQADVDLTDALESLEADPNTRVVAAYVEGFSDGRRFVEVAARMTPRKPLVILKAGRTPSGTRAVASHTGALAGADRAFLAACRRAGAIPVENLEELVDGAIALACRQPLAGPRVAILTNAGGPAAVGADALDRQGLEVGRLSAETCQRLQEVCPPGAMVGNPVDLLGGPQPHHYAAAMEVLLAAPEVDGVMVVFVPQAIMPPHDVAVAVARAATRFSSGGGPQAEKPVVCCISGGGGIRAAARALHAHSVPHYLTPARAALGLATLRRYHQIQACPADGTQPMGGVDRARALDLIRSAQSAGERVLNPQVAAEVAAAYGITVPASALAATAKEAEELAARLGYPVAVKRVAPGLVHKADVGGVALDLGNAEEVRAAFAGLVGPGEHGMLQQMVQGGVEVIAGGHRDRQFGPLVMFGLGGAYVEILQDVAFRLAPLGRAEALDVIAETAAGRLLAGVRGRPPCDVNAVADALQRVAQLMTDLPQVAEVDLNPLIVSTDGAGAVAVDVRIVLEDDAQPSSGTPPEGCGE